MEYQLTEESLERALLDIQKYGNAPFSIKPKKLIVSEDGWDQLIYLGTGDEKGIEEWKQMDDKRDPANAWYNKKRWWIWKVLLFGRRLSSVSEDDKIRIKTKGKIKLSRHTIKKLNERQRRKNNPRKRTYFEVYGY